MTGTGSTQRDNGVFFHERLCRVPTLRVVVVGFLLLLALIIFLASSIHPFLAETDPVNGEVLIVEGWLPDYALGEALAVSRNREYPLMLTTGEPLPRGYHLSAYGTYAELARAIMVESGAGSDSVIAVPSPAVRTDRTFASALAVRRWLSARGRLPQAVDVFSYGAHARRTRMLFQEVLGDSVRVGVFAGHDQGYNPDEWWATSRGFEDVVMETIGWAYASIWSPAGE
jgi:hypothetical protein